MLDTVYQALSHAGRLAGASDGARVVERDGVLALLVPAGPERSVANSVVYESAEALRAPTTRSPRPTTRSAPWTVWVHPATARAAELLAERGHVLDAEPEAMALTLERPARAPRADGADGDGDVGTSRDQRPRLRLRADSFSRALGGRRWSAARSTWRAGTAGPSAAW